MASDQEFCLRWNNHQSTLVSVFDRLLSTEIMTDVTLAAEGRSIKAHRLVLSACSPFFQEVLNSNPDKHMVIFLKDVPYEELRALVSYMYKGEVSVAQDRLTSLIRIAENLKVRGLAEPDETPSKKLPPLPKLTPAVIKRDPNTQRPSTPSSKKRRKAESQSNSLSSGPNPSTENGEESQPLNNEGQSLLEKSLLMPREINANHVEYTPQAAGPSVNVKKEEITMESADEAEDGDDWSGPEGEEQQGSWQETPENVPDTPGENFNQGSYSCQVCGRRFVKEGSMRSHLSLDCSTKRYTCEHCNCSFKRKYHLNRHMRVHTRETYNENHQALNALSVSVPLPPPPIPFEIEGAIFDETKIKQEP
ncbi:broad-complex core protein isoforms 1/2/3/4/5-like isoform X3 [Artemia franciscana]|uniref:broad-complex core protein isoforms 1/2/3/4/5-like isoform X3 n=1 Tax=Artemia franciscana TaxID=6661 RepID=UPI0032DB0FC4